MMKRVREREEGRTSESEQKRGRISRKRGGKQVWIVADGVCVPVQYSMYWYACSYICIYARKLAGTFSAQDCAAALVRTCSLNFYLKLYCTSLTLLRRSLSYKEITCAGKGKRECCRVLRDRDAGIVTQLSLHGPKEDKKQRRMMQREEVAIKNDSAKEEQ